MQQRGVPYDEGRVECRKAEIRAWTDSLKCGLTEKAAENPWSWTCEIPVKTDDCYEGQSRKGWEIQNGTSEMILIFLCKIN